MRDDEKAVEKGRLMNGARNTCAHVGYVTYTVDLEGLHGQRGKKNGFSDGRRIRCGVF